MKLIKAADPDSALKNELRERWITESPKYKQAAAARDSADTAASSVPWNADALAYVEAVKVARAARAAARAALEAARSELEGLFDAAVKVPDIDLEQVPGYTPFPPAVPPPPIPSPDPSPTPLTPPG